MATPSLPERPVDPRRYFESVDDRREVLPDRKPVCLYLETTNRCNLLCTTCPRTYAELEPPADMSWELFTSIVDRCPAARAVLHGVGEPMLVKNPPRMVRYLKDRGTTFCSTPTAPSSTSARRAWIAAGSELRVSLDAATEVLPVRRQELLQAHPQERARLRELQEREGTDRRASRPAHRLKETSRVAGRVAASIGQEVICSAWSSSIRGHRARAARPGSPTRRAAGSRRHPKPPRSLNPMA